MLRNHSLFSSKEEKAAVTLQSAIRGSQVRKQYQIIELSPNQQTKYATMVIGNDPIINGLDKYHDADNKIALIGTSGIRSVALACELGNNTHTPKIMIVDNSQMVCDFWQRIRDFARDDQTAATDEIFNKNLERFLNQNQKLYHRPKNDRELQTLSNIYLNQNIPDYFKTLFKKHGYDYVRAVICHASIIRQSWADIQVFATVKNILQHLGIDKIYMYPSNIVACDEDIADEVLRNIENMSPKLSIHTDYYGEVCGIPRNVYLLEKQDPAYVKNCLFPSTSEVSSSNMIQMDLKTFLLLALREHEINNLLNSKDPFALRNTLS